MEQLCNQVFPATDFSTNMPDDYFADRAIFTMRNREIVEFNDYVVQHLPGALEARFSVNKTVADGPDDDLADYTAEYLQSIDSLGLPRSVKPQAGHASHAAAQYTARGGTLQWNPSTYTRVTAARHHGKGSYWGSSRLRTPDPSHHVDVE
jgi:hypothetical protein